MHAHLLTLQLLCDRKIVPPAIKGVDAVQDAVDAMKHLEKRVCEIAGVHYDQYSAQRPYLKAMAACFKTGVRRVSVVSQKLCLAPSLIVCAHHFILYNMYCCYCNCVQGVMDMLAPFLRVGKPVPAEGDRASVMQEVAKLGKGEQGGEEESKTTNKKDMEYGKKGDKQEANQELEVAYVDAWRSSS